MQGIVPLIPTSTKIEYINQLLRIGFDTIDFGSFVSPKAIPQMADTAQVLEGLDLTAAKSKLLAIVANQRGAEEACRHGAIKEVLSEKSVQDVTIGAISDAVIEIRSRKLPDPEVIGNAGSFFKNPSVDRDFFETLKKNYPAIPSFPGENGLVKIPAAWLIEQCGWKGKTLGNIGVHRHQALVLVNYGDGEGGKIWELAMDIQSSVREKFDIRLHPEVNVIR